MKRSIALLAMAAWSCAAAAGNVEVTVRTSAGTPVEDAAVVLEPASKAPLRRAHATIEQRDREFLPYLTIVQKGTSVDFPNRDPFKHHVYSFSPAKTFEIKLYADKPASPVVFDKTGEVILGCNIHDWMSAHVLVVDTPWFAKTGAGGIARVEKAPAGRYRLRVWHPRQKAAAQVLDVELKEAARRIDVTLDVAPRPAVSKLPAGLDGY